MAIKAPPPSPVAAAAPAAAAAAPAPAPALAPPGAAVLPAASAPLGPPLLAKAAVPDMMPLELHQQLTELEQWATANNSDARSDTIAFWSLKIPAILASASAGVWAHFQLTTVSVIAGALASVCVIVDGVHPRGMLRNIHLRAYHDIRILATNMMSQWRSRSANAKADDTARQIIRDAEKERKRIATYIRDAETALKFKNEA